MGRTRPNICTWSNEDLPIMTAHVVQRGTRSLSKGQQGEYVGRRDHVVQDVLSSHHIQTASTSRDLGMSYIPTEYSIRGVEFNDLISVTHQVGKIMKPCSDGNEVSNLDISLCSFHQPSLTLPKMNRRTTNTITQHITDTAMDGWLRMSEGIAVILACR